jgi:choline dehydrogenase-like flavoprotein
MLVDARTLSPGDALKTDVCVLGAGPVGLTIARELAAHGASVYVLELGATDEEPGHPTSNDGLRGEVSDPAYPELETTRAASFGGTVAIWTSEVARHQLGARYGLLQAIDLESRDSVAHSGWPFDRAQLDPYYARASDICEIAPFSEDPGEWELPPRTVRLPLGNDVTTRIVRYGFRSIFTEGYRSWAEAVPNVTVFLNACALEIETDESGTTADRVRAVSAPGRTFTVRPRVVVLALGGIENARLLLLSDGVTSAGLGNTHDLVGRFFMDHPTATGRFVPAAPRAVRRLGLYDTLSNNGGVGQGMLGLSESAIRREQLLNGGVILAPTLERWMQALSSATELSSAVRAGRIPDDAARHVLNVARGTDAVATSAHRRLVERVPMLEPTGRFWPTSRLLNTFDIGHIAGWSRLPFADRRFKSFGFFHVLEQAPEPERRVTLSPRRDRFGRRLARLQWFITERELGSMRRTQEIIAAEMSRAGLGRLLTTAELGPVDDITQNIFPSAHHHLGTTRMHRNPREGAVDENCRIHGTTNLFACGTSVFPTGGFINPTLTALALAVRLAEHIGAVTRTLPEARPDR